ncbi:hypothetical protein HDF16_000239 [Granulicella aggregans]|uniref:Uncharacterized protein n=1 Tax=Granulicella aggregans TaxID=474949 RepID=A0A7W7Z928_9BACT|nr:hypothetical protein [Granulicella aggregans]MBB5055570.1 hypothetical protein [Granulicella aggregans]
MDVSTFTRHFPRLYHLTFASNLPSIREHGLLSAQALADLYSFSSEETAAVLKQRRRCIQQLHGITLRDQHAAQESKMKSCLVGITVPEWITLLNSKIFFFVSKEKAEVLARSYAAYDNLLLDVDTAALLSTHGEHASLCRINSGSFLYNPRPRGRASFIPLHAYSYKNKRDTPAELSIDKTIPNVLQMSSIAL